MSSATIPHGATVVEHPLVRVKLTRLRDANTTPAEFRSRLAEIARLLAFEATRDLETLAKTVCTPLAECNGGALAHPVILAPILRAGLGMAEAILDVVPEAKVGHIGMKRDEQTHRPASYYFNLPPQLADADVFILDPMLATGHSACAAITKLKAAGAKRIRLICCVSCPEGLAQMHREHPDVKIFTAAIDAGLNENAYIVPGLGDAGDRCFGTL